MSAFLISLTGADRRLLAQQAPHDVAKYAGIGGAVLTTAVFAALSSTFALRMAAGAPLLLAALFGLVWGLAILNLDRWLVAANARQSSWWRNVLVALPRVLMALRIGVVMSTPLVLQLFSPEIETELVMMRQRAQAAFEQDLRSAWTPSRRSTTQPSAPSPARRTAPAEAVAPVQGRRTRRRAPGETASPRNVGRSQRP